MHGVWPQSPCKQMEPRATVVQSVPSALARPPPRPAHTLFPPPALIPPSMEWAPGSFGPLLRASERPLCLLCRVGLCRGSLKVPPAGFGPSTLLGGCRGRASYRVGPAIVRGRSALQRLSSMGACNLRALQQRVFCRPLGL